MKKILLISDTHNSLDDAVVKHAKQVDEVWHAGDIGSLALLEKLQSITTVRAVYGNIDGQDLRIRIPQVAVFECEGLKVMMTHIGGYPKHYEQSIYAQLLTEKPKLFISGHSHILKVKFDKTLGMLHINPGAAGIYGFHKVRTMVRFVVDNGVFKDLEVIELAG